MTEIEIIKNLKKLDTEITNRRKKNRLKYYNTSEPVHQKQVSFHQSQKRNRWVFGGNRSGKTECGAVETVWMARGNSPYRKNRKATNGWVVSISREVQRDVAQSKILDYLNPDWIEKIVMVSGRSDDPRGGVIDYIAVRSESGGISKIGFKSCDQGREKFQGASLDYVWFDEEPPEDIYTECRMRVLDRKGDIFGTMTPLKGLTFVYNKIWLNGDDDPEVECTCMEWADNPFLDKDEVVALTATMSQEEILSRRYGKFSASKGLVYHEFDPKIHVIKPFEIPHEWYDNMSIDPGLNNPLSCHWYAVDGDGTVFVIAEHYEAGKDIGYHVGAIKSVSEALEWHTDFTGRYTSLIDSSASQRTLASSKSVAEQFIDGGISVNTKVNKDLFAGIARVKSYLKDSNGKPRIYIFENCVNLIKELKAYYWDEGDVPKKKDDHALDELRYYIMSKPEASKGISAVKGLIARDKERLLRRLLRRRKVSRARRR